MNNPKTRQEWIYNELINEPNTAFVPLFSVYFEKFSKSEVTFSKDWNKANDLFNKYQKEVNKAKVNASIKEEVKAVKIGLKTKIERLLILQKLIDECLEQLTTKQCNDTIVLDGEIIPFKRLMNQRELNDTRKTLNELQKEISKIEGDYATTNITINDKRQGFIEYEIE